MEYDLNYFVDIMAKLCGIPGRIYENNKKIAFFSSLNFVIDPIILIEDTLKNYTNSIGYIYSDDFYYYGYVNYQNKMIILGPSRIIKADDLTLSKLSLALKVDKNDISEFKMAMKSLPLLPLESLLQSLCALNYLLNHEKKSLKDILVDSSFKYNESISLTNEYIDEHNTYDIESSIVRIVKYGLLDELQEWLKKAPAVRGGVLSTDALRQTKNTFITVATLASRAAINGGVDINEALSLSDLYIQKMESMNVYSDITSLQLKMIFDYTNKVSKIRGNDNSAFLISINKYIYLHLSEPIKSKDICKALYLSKSVLFAKIKKETGKTVSSYILNIKINEAKELLKDSDKSIASISLYLGFSSQSHFNRTFNIYCGMSPKKYQEKFKR